MPKCKCYTINAATGTNLLWYTSSTGGTGSGTTPIPLTTNVGTTDYFVSQTVNSCESSRAQIAVTVNAIPGLPTTTNSFTYCQNTNATVLSATGSNLLWYTDTTLTGSSTSPTPSTNIAGTTNYYVSQTINGCESPKAQITITVNALPSLPTVTNSITYCQNATALILTATGSNLLWYTTATGGTGNTNAPTPSTTSVGSTNYYVSQSINNCESYRAIITITVNAIPGIPTVTNTINYCQGNTSTLLTATGSNLLWYTNATGGNGNTNAPIPSTSVIGTTYFYVSQTVNGCESSRAQISVIINAVPQTPIINQVGNTLYSSSTAGNQWYLLTTGLISGATGQTYAPQQIGDYFAKVTLSGCSSDSSNIIHYDNTGIGENENNNGVKVYPNPVSNELIIELVGNKENVLFEIFNSIGQSIYKGNLIEKTTVQTTNFAQGVYIIKLENGKVFEFKKIVKE